MTTTAPASALLSASASATPVEATNGPAPVHSPIPYVVLADDSDEAYNLLVRGHALESKFSSDEAAEARRKLALRQNNQADGLRSGALALGVLALFSFAFLWDSEAHAWVVAQAIFALVLAVVGFAWGARLETSDDRLLTALSHYPGLCAQLKTLTQANEAAKAYVSAVNASGRQLRLFDVACANVKASDAARAALSAEQRQVCAELHSL